MFSQKINKTEIVEKLKTQFARRPILVFAVPFVILLLLAAVIVLILSLGSPEGDTYVPPTAGGSSSVPVMGGAEQTPTIEILPDTEREIPKKDPFADFTGQGSLKLTGIISSSTGSSAAIITSGDRSYIVQPGGGVGETGWTVTEINESDIVLISGDAEKTLELDPDPE